MAGVFFLSCFRLLGCLVADFFALYSVNAKSKTTHQKGRNNQKQGTNKHKNKTKHKIIQRSRKLRNTLKQHKKVARKVLSEAFRLLHFRPLGLSVPYAIGPGRGGEEVVEGKGGGEGLDSFKPSVSCSIADFFIETWRCKSLWCKLCLVCGGSR